MPKAFLALLRDVLGIFLAAVLAVGLAGRHDPGFLALILLVGGPGLFLVMRRHLARILAGPAAARTEAPAEDPAAATAVLLEAVPAPVLVLDAGRDVRFANAAATRLFGGALAGRSLMAFLRHPPLLAAIDRAAAGETTAGETTGGETTGGETADGVDLPDTKGRRLVARMKAIDPPLPGGGTLLILIEDATAAERAETLRRDFVANVSHELKTPIATLMGFIETLRGPAREDVAARERFLGIMQTEAARMSRLVADLLSLSRIEMNEHQPPAGRADLGAIIKTVLDGLTLKAQQRGIDIVTPARDGLPAVAGDADELTQVVQNLLDNALKYAPPQSIVSIGVERIVDPVECKARLSGLREPKGMVALSIADQGEGIAREHIPRLTERFYRVDSARSRELGGTGLGLAIVKHIVSRHRGSLEIESGPGKGSVFTVYLPLAEGRDTPAS